ncbi:hypothetical protein [Oricola thermophila]|uniref:Uncharacterized protein n=1 Tax=Oricola thermophila TaxID=2742145 RepID=A0A6N1VA58_9HYPH|nr:hypothetical protein [Oricola thermophila]QKV17826.1 hypothetical protein HTY61_04815 [Oricola thermophila]
MTEKWTKGPWRCGGNPYDPGEPPFVISETEGVICTINLKRPYNIARANGNLMAAAPELYHELDMQVRNCPVCKGTGMAVDVLDLITEESPEKKPCTRCASSRAALAKARGESS